MHGADQDLAVRKFLRGAFVPGEIALPRMALRSRREQPALIESGDHVSPILKQFWRAVAEVPDSVAPAWNRCARGWTCPFPDGSESRTRSYGSLRAPVRQCARAADLAR